jgi:hypothetical protein
LIADIRLENALSKEFPLLLEELEVDDVEAAASSVKRLAVLCKLEISMKVNPFHINFSEIRLPKAEVLRVICENCSSMRN